MACKLSTVCRGSPGFSNLLITAVTESVCQCHCLGCCMRASPPPVVTTSTHSMKDLFPTWVTLQYPVLGCKDARQVPVAAASKSKSAETHAARHMCVPCQMAAHLRHSRSAIPALPISSMQPVSSDACQPPPGTRQNAAATQLQLQNCVGTLQCHNHSHVASDMQAGASLHEPVHQTNVPAKQHPSALSHPSWQVP